MKEERDEYSAPWWKTKFGAWVCKYGTRRLAIELQVTKSAVHAWVRGEIAPRPPKAKAIVSLSNRKLTLADVYNQAALVEEKLAALDARAIAIVAESPAHA